MQPSIDRQAWLFNGYARRAILPLRLRQTRQPNALHVDFVGHIAGLHPEGLTLCNWRLNHSPFARSVRMRIRPSSNWAPPQPRCSSTDWLTYVQPRPSGISWRVGHEKSMGLPPNLW